MLVRSPLLELSLDTGHEPTRPLRSTPPEPGPASPNWGLWLTWATALACLALAACLQNPLLLSLRDWAPAVLILASSLGILAALRPRSSGRRRQHLLAIAWLVVLSLACAGEYVQHRHKQAVLAAAARAPAQMAALGEHLVVGYERVDDVRELARRGLIGGVFVTGRNARGKTLAQLRAELASLQDLRRQAGLPPLMIATDQEGGPVSRLSPPLPYQPALSSLTEPGLPGPELARRAASYASRQAQALAALGINADFSPVVDLKPSRPPGGLDFHTRIAERAISDQPETVALVAAAYSRALSAQGVTPTLKHFPGLGRVDADTHHFSAHLASPRAELEARDWRPFRQVLSQTPAMLMIGHVVLDAVDPSRPASLSRPVLDGLLRREWGYQGVLISDDMTMAAVYDRGLCRASREALNAGMDLLLVAYDWEKYYAVMDCLRQAALAGNLADLGASHRRLDNAPWRHPGVNRPPAVL